MIGELVRDWRYRCQPSSNPWDLARQFRDLDKLKKIEGSGRVSGEMYVLSDRGVISYNYNGATLYTFISNFQDNLRSILGVSKGKKFESYCDLSVKEGKARYSFTFRAGENLHGLFKRISMSGKLNYDFQVAK